MKTFFIILTLLSISTVFAGEMKKIDTAARETVANAYYTGMDNDGYYDFMYYEIWNAKLEPKKYTGCLVVVSGQTTETVSNVRYEIWFKVCINKTTDGDYTGYLLNI
jgi:hypothetical protein